MTRSDRESIILQVWQPWDVSKPYRPSKCRAISEDSGRSWRFLGTINAGGKSVFLSTVHSVGVFPKLASGFNQTATISSTTAGIVLMSLGRASATGAGLSLWATRVEDKISFSADTVSSATFVVLWAFFC